MEQWNFISHHCTVHQPQLPTNACPHATLQPVDFHLLTNTKQTPTYLHTYTEKKMKNGMHRMKSRELEVGDVLRGQRRMKNKKRRREQKRVLVFKCGNPNVHMNNNIFNAVERYFFLQPYTAK